MRLLEASIYDLLASHTQVVSAARPASAPRDRGHGGASNAFAFAPFEQGTVDPVIWDSLGLGGGGGASDDFDADLAVLDREAGRVDFTLPQLTKVGRTGAGGEGGVGIKP